MAAESGLLKVLICWARKGISQMRLSHTRATAAAVFDEPNLVSAAGLVPVLALAERCGLPQLADRYLSVPTDKGAHAGAKVTSLVAGMIAGADSLDDMALQALRALDAGVVPALRAVFVGPPFGGIPHAPGGRTQQRVDRGGQIGG